MYDDDDAVRPQPETDDEDAREAIVAADDTGLVAQRITLVEATVGDTETGSDDER